MPPRLRIPPAYEGFWFRMGDFAFDFFSLAVNLADVVTDVIICYWWYEHQMWGYFWMAMAVFFIAQVAYSVLFVLRYCNKDRGDCHRIFWFLVVFPFAQSVPFLIWFQSYDFVWFKQFLECLGLEAHNYYTSGRYKDPLKAYIAKKLRVHGGFITEAVVESVPQSILQMIAIVTHGHATAVDIISISVSILSVASRGFMISYCIDRCTFVFNFVCFVADVFGVFCIVSWLFFVPHGVHATVYSVTFLPSLPIHYGFSVVWVYKLLVVAVVGIIACFLLFLSQTYGTIVANTRVVTTVCHHLRDGFILLGMLLFGTLLFLPALVVTEAMTLSLLPLLVFRSLDSAHANNAAPWTKLLNFLKAAPNATDFQKRLSIANRHFAVAYLKFLGLNAANNWSNIHRPQLLQNPRYLAAWAMVADTPGQPKQSPSDEVQLRQEQSSSTTTRGSNLDVVRTKWGEAIHDLRLIARDNIFQAIGLVYAVLIAIPVFTLSSLCNLLFPIVCFFSTPFKSIGALQLVLTMVMFCCFLTLIALSYWVHIFRKCTTNLNLFGMRLRYDDADAITLQYTTQRMNRAKETSAGVCILVASAAATSSPLSGHVVNLLPEIFRLAGLRERCEMNVKQFIQSAAYKQLVDSTALSGNESIDNNDNNNDNGEERLTLLASQSPPISPRQIVTLSSPPPLLSTTTTTTTTSTITTTTTTTATPVTVTIHLPYSSSSSSSSSSSTSTFTSTSTVTFTSTSTAPSSSPVSLVIVPASSVSSSSSSSTLPLAPSSSITSSSTITITTTTPTTTTTTSTLSGRGTVASSKVFTTPVKSKATTTIAATTTATTGGVPKRTVVPSPPSSSSNSQGLHASLLSPQSQSSSSPLLPLLSSSQHSSVGPVLDTSPLSSLESTPTLALPRSAPSHSVPLTSSRLFHLPPRPPSPPPPPPPAPPAPLYGNKNNHVQSNNSQLTTTSSTSSASPFDRLKSSNPIQQASTAHTHSTSTLSQVNTNKVSQRRPPARESREGWWHRSWPREELNRISPTSSSTAPPSHGRLTHSQSHSQLLSLVDSIEQTSEHHGEHCFHRHDEKEKEKKDNQFHEESKSEANRQSPGKQ